MTKKNNRRKYILIFSLAALLVVAIAIGLSQAKYKTEKVMQGKVRFTATLAEEIKIQEHKAERQNDGSYVLLTDEDSVQDNDYKLMPGVDLPKDPFITVAGKTDLAGWLFVEVVPGAAFPATVKYEISSDWIDTGLLGDNNGKLYVYKQTIKKADTLNGSALKEFYILKKDAAGNTLTVSQDVARTTKVDLDFYAYLCQALTDSAATDFQSCFGTYPTAAPSPTPTQG